MADHTVTQIQPILNKKIKDMTGFRFDHLIVIGYVGSISYGYDNQRRAQWLCKCDCGNNVILTGCSLRNKAMRTRSCGCNSVDCSTPADRERIAKRKSRTPTYRSWDSMHNRCNDPDNSNYGGRGITVCERWNNFENFLEDMGERPSKKLSIDRIDNNGNYEPGNCRWATEIEQKNNKRTNRKITFQGKTLTMAEWSRETGIDYNHLRSRINQNGWSIERALTTPIIRRKKMVSKKAVLKP